MRRGVPAVNYYHFKEHFYQPGGSLEDNFLEEIYRDSEHCGMGGVSNNVTSPQVKEGD